MAFYKAKFTDKHHSVGGIISTILGLMTLVLLVICVRKSYLMEGNGGIMLGAMGVVSFFLGLSGCAIGLISFREMDKYYIFSKIGSLLCGILTVILVSIFLIGM